MEFPSISELESEELTTGVAWDHLHPEFGTIKMPGRTEMEQGASGMGRPTVEPLVMEETPKLYSNTSKQRVTVVSFRE